MLWRQLITSMGFWFLICVFVGSAGTAILIGFCFESQVRKRLAESGIVTTAEVVAHDRDDAHVRLVYTDQHGVRHKRAHDVPVHWNLPADRRVRFRFDPTDYLLYAFDGPDGRSRTGRSDYLPLMIGNVKHRDRMCTAGTRRR